MLELFFDSMELFAWNSSQKMQFQVKSATRRSFVVYTTQFVVCVLSFGVGRIGCCYNNITPAHRSVLVQEELQGNRSPFCLTLRTHLISHYAIFVSFPALLRALRFHLTEEVMTTTRETVRDLSVDMFQQCFQWLYQRWQTCIATNGDHFEGGCGGRPCYTASCDTSRILLVPTLHAPVSKRNDCSSTRVA